MTGSGRTFAKVLIANRGEIAVRILRTLRVLGIPGAVVHHAADAGSRAVREADETYQIAGDPPVAAYLDGDQIIAAARTLGADAIHPGYGFLSENADFARQVAEAGLTFIGPAPDVIALMGDKIAANAFAARHSLPLIPSTTAADDAKDLANAAADLGFPLVIKAAAGGGGKGMHVVEDRAALDERLAVARREAERYFGDGRLYCERYVERPRHIEVQVLADAAGTCIHLGERECSIQRRFQKVIEETPAPGLSSDLRADICAAAVDIARAAGYTGAGTVEFLLAPNGAFYFLEMNTRLQVEHPVTEMVTGVDLVAEQMRVAGGGTLSVTQDQVVPAGHAIECRVYAEDADDGFRPATGRLLALHEPAGPGVRCDSGVLAGQAVTAAFDPMLAKVAAHGVDRAQAIARLAAALRETVMLGVTTNVAWLQRVLADEAFATGDIDTGFVGRRAHALEAVPPGEDVRDAILAAAALGRRGLPGGVAPPEPYRSIGPWRN